MHILCTAFVEQRILASRKAIGETQASANEETKSSAGDKYETGRAMAQLEIEKHSTQLAGLLEQKKILAAINPLLEKTTVQSGSLAFTTFGNFYVSIAAGELQVDGTRYFAVSPASPVAKALLGAAAGDVVSFNNRNYVIDKVE